MEFVVAFLVVAWILHLFDGLKLTAERVNWTPLAWAFFMLALAVQTYELYENSGTFR